MVTAHQAITLEVLSRYKPDVVDLKEFDELVQQPTPWIGNDKQDIRRKTRSNTSNELRERTPPERGNKRRPASFSATRSGRRRAKPFRASSTEGCRDVHGNV